MARLLPIAIAVYLFVAPAIAQDQPTLTVYTYDSFAAEWGPGPALKADFEATCNCTLDIVATDSSIGALRRVQLEGSSSPADVILGLDTATAGQARATGLFAEHGLPVDALDIPLAWTDAQFVPVDYGYFAFVYDSDLVAAAPTSFEDLIALPDDFKIVIQDPRSDTPGFGLMLWIKASYGDRAPEIWEGLRPHIVTMTRGWSEAYALFLEGEADMVLSYTTSPAYHAIAESDDSYRAAIFTEGHYPQIEVAGILASTDQPDLARAFLRYLLGPDAQVILPTTNWMYPAIDIGEGLPAAFAATPRPETVLTIDEATIEANRDAWIAEQLDALQ